MRRAMADAEVGDDVLDRDPTTARLEGRVAELLGMDDALFFPSGTQANQTAIALLTRPGTELLLEANAHLVHYEFAGVAANWGVQIRPIATPDGVAHGRPGARGVAAGFPARAPCRRHRGGEHPQRGGGKVMAVEVMAGIAAAARDAGLPLHLDGARLWNAAAALGVPVSRLTTGARTVMVSFSKGLGCPVGSCLAIPAGERARAWEIRKRLGGGMRQSGILAAAALWALDHNVARLADDHANARLLAERLARCPAVRAEPPQSNVVMVDLVRDGETAEAAVGKLARAGVLVVPFGPRRLRAVTHLDVTRQDVERASDVIARTLA